MKSKIKTYIILFFITQNFSACNSQVSVQVTTQKCIYDTKYSGEKIVINLKTGTSSLQSSTEYWLSDFIDLSDKIKLLIIEKLLEYSADTSLCCMNVVNRSFNGIEGCGGKPKDAIRYPVQVDALFMINRLCWPKLMELYSCTPVLYDILLQNQINNDPVKVKEVFDEYRAWFEECKSKGSIGDYFPFNRGRYVWYGGRKSMVAQK